VQARAVVRYTHRLNSRTIKGMLGAKRQFFLSPTGSKHRLPTCHGQGMDWTGRMLQGARGSVWEWSCPTSAQSTWWIYRQWWYRTQINSIECCIRIFYL